MLRKMAVAACLIPMLAACSQSGRAPLGRALPPASAIVPQPVPLPVRRADDDPVATAAEHRTVAAENGRRLGAAHRNYEALRRDIGGADIE